MAQDVAKGATRVAITEAVAEALEEAPEGGQTAQEAVQHGTACSSPPLIFGLEHGPRQGDRGSRQEVSRAMAGEASRPEAFTLLLLLLMTHFDRIDRGRGYT